MIIGCRFSLFLFSGAGENYVPGWKDRTCRTHLIASPLVLVIRLIATATQLNMATHQSLITSHVNVSIAMSRSLISTALA